MNIPYSRDETIRVNMVDRTLQFENENKCCKSPKNLRTVNIKVPTQALILSNKRVN